MNEVKRMLNEMQTLGSHAATEVDVIDEPGLDWLLEVEKGKEVVICGLAEGVFVQTLIGYKKGKDWNTEKLLNWNFGACDEWRTRDGSEQGWRHPMEGCSTEELEDADKLVYMRNEEAAVCTRSLADLARMRNVADAHRSTKKRADLIKEMRTQHGNLHSAYSATVNGCTRTLEQIARIL